MHDPASTPTESQPTDKMSDQSVQKPALQPADSTTAPPSTADTDGAKSDNTAFPLMNLPPELRVKIYRHHFEDFICSKEFICTVWTANRQKFLFLLQSSSQVRREAAPIFYKESLPNKDLRTKHRYMLVNEPDVRRQDRVEALRELAVQYDPDVEVSACYNPRKRYIGADFTYEFVTTFVEIRPRRLEPQ
jgi:hypothetical protein